MQTRALRFTVSGAVQGVGFRYATQRKAQELGLTGWVRNLPDGNVEGVAQGSADALDALRQWLSVGPRFAKVSGLTLTEEEPRPRPAFVIER